MRRSRLQNDEEVAGTSALHAVERTLDAMAADEALREELLRHGGVPARPGDACASTASGSGRSSTTTRSWPGRRLVGDDGSRAAWLIAQYSIEDPGLQKRCLEALDVAVAYGDADPVHYAYLLDRVRMADGLDQLYGSQFVTGADGELTPWPVDDPAKVEERRRRLGLPPFAEHAAAMSAQWHARRTRRRCRRRSAGHERVVHGAPAVPRGDRAVGPEHLAERVEHARCRRFRRGRTAARSPCARRGRRPATRRAGRAGT